LEAFQQVPRREREPVALIDLRFVDDAKSDRIDPELIGELIQGGFGGIEPGYSSGTAHICSAADVSFGAAKGHAQVRDTVLERRRFATILVMGIKHRPRVNVVVLQGDQFSLSRGTEAYALLRTRAMTDGMEHHLASEDQSYGTAQLSGSGRGKRTERPRPELASKTRTHEPRDNTHILDRQAEHLREHTPQVYYSLRGLVQRQRFTVPDGGR